MQTNIKIRPRNGFFEILLRDPIFEAQEIVITEETANTLLGILGVYIDDPCILDQIRQHLEIVKDLLEENKKMITQLSRQLFSLPTPSLNKVIESIAILSSNNTRIEDILDRILNRIHELQLQLEETEGY